MQRTRALALALSIPLALLAHAERASAQGASRTDGATAQALADDDWRVALRERIARIDRDSPGQLGVYVKRLDTDEALSYAGRQPWYLSSTVKVLVGIAVLQQVDAGKLSLQSQLAVQEQDRVDGSGELVWQRPGTQYTVESLLTRMLGVSDNTAANLLIRTAGLDALNSTARAAMGAGGVAHLTNFIQVRQEVYAELHPDARKLSNQQLVEVARTPTGPNKVEAIRKAIGVERSELRAKNFGEAYDRYYQRRLNSATLDAYGDMLGKLVRGQLLSPDSTQFIFKAMKFGRRGDYRLEGGIPKSEMIIHKTGTQHRRACHMAVINPQDGGARGIVVATCAADLDDQRQAGDVFRRVGSAVTEVLIAPALAAAR